jgi:hypothetical protein
MPVVIEVAADGDGWRLTGEKDLGWFAGGVYRYEGRVAGDEFRATYTSPNDRGVFEMKRAPDPGSF